MDDPAVAPAAVEPPAAAPVATLAAALAPLAAATSEQESGILGLLGKDWFSNLIALVGVVIALIGAGYGVLEGLKNSGLQKAKSEAEKTSMALQTENMRLTAENTRLNRSSRLLDITKTIQTEANAFGGSEIKLPKLTTEARFRSDDNSAPTDARTMHSLNLSPI